MATTSGISSILDSGLSSGTTGATAAADDSTSDRFLTLLVSQLKNQDPLNPLDNAQITSQLAQLSTVSGINQLNSTLASLSASFDAKQYLQAAGLVGHEVIVDGNSMSLVADRSAHGAFDLSADADQVSVTITDSAGKQVRKLDLGAQPAGLATFEWDGKDESGAAASAGTYKISLTASKGSTTLTATPLAVGQVSGLVPGANGGALQVTGVGRVDVASVREIGPIPQ